MLDATENPRGESGPGWIIDGWEIVSERDDDDECRIWAHAAVRGDERRELDVDPYRPITTELAEMLVATGFPTRANFASAFPVNLDQVSALYWRQRALQAEAALQKLAA